ncbi:hypothetical protein [Dendrosporobacter sp. 1207_IL3150]|uniref:hypothetical protein n=1 Tax=Dendrosporobacter sp. 1207_IL3150 TaxID=3084054 RepID=UPI002FD89B08
MQIIFRKNLQAVYIFLAVLLFMPSVVSAAGDTVDSITVQVTTGDTAPAPPARITKRMAASVHTIGENVLAGHTIVDVTEKKASYEKLVREVFDRILVGYSVKQVNITPGTSTRIMVEVTPWGEVINNVILDIDFNGLSPELANLMQRDLGNIEERIDSVLLGLPIDAVDWAGGVSKSVVSELLSAQLPEFRSNLEIVPGPTTIVKLSLIPQGKLIQDVRVSLRSNTIPNVLLLQARPTVTEAANTLNGLPVAFVERHRSYFTEKIKTAAAEHPVTRRYELTVNPTIDASANTEISLDVETTKYNLSLEGYLDIGRQDDSTSLKLHVGKYASPKDELFLDIEFIPNSVTWRFLPGWGHSLSSVTTVGIKYDISEKDGVLWTKQDLGSNWQLRLERNQSWSLNELGVRYKLHEFLSAEYVFTDNENWLRLVGNL